MENEINELNGKVAELMDTGLDQAASYAPKLLLAIVTLVIGLWIINRVIGGIGKVLDVRKVEVTLKNFLTSLFSVLFKALLLISVASMVGIETTSFVAIIGAAGLAVGLALQGSLGNFAGGVLILLFKPYKVGDVIEAQGHIGKVAEIQIFVTKLTTPDNKLIIIPNGPLSNGSLTNFSAMDTRRVDMVFGIGYGDDIKKTKEVLEGLVKAEERVLKDQDYTIAVSALADSSVNFVVRIWVNSADYWGVYFDMHEKVKLAFDEQGISIPFPQRDVHLYKHEAV